MKFATKPSRKTAEYIEYVLTRITLIGAAYITVVCLVPEWLIAQNGSLASALGSIPKPDAKDSIVMGNMDAAARLKAASGAAFDQAYVESQVAGHTRALAFLQQADSQMTPTKFLVLSIGIGVGTTVVLPILRVPMYAAPLGVILGFVPFIALFMKRKRRLGAFGKQLPEALELIGRALRAGHSLASGFKLVADEMPAPIGVEFERCYEAQNLGVPLEEAIANLKTVPPDSQLVRTARDVGVSFGAPDEERHHHGEGCDQ